MFLACTPVTRFLLEFLRSGYNWTVGGIATAQIVAAATIVAAVAILGLRHAQPGERRRAGLSPGRRPSRGQPSPEPGEPSPGSDDGPGRQRGWPNPRRGPDDRRGGSLQAMAAAPRGR